MSKQPVWLYTNFLGISNVFAYFCNAGQRFPMKFNIETDRKIVVYLTFFKAGGQGRTILEKFLDPGRHSFNHLLDTENSGNIWSDKPGNSRYGIIVASPDYKNKYSMRAEKIDEPHGDTYRLWRTARVKVFIDLLSPNQLALTEEAVFSHQPMPTDDEWKEVERALGKGNILEDF